jgi:hypothetical protein
LEAGHDVLLSVAEAIVYLVRRTLVGGYTRKHVTSFIPCVPYQSGCAQGIKAGGLTLLRRITLPRTWLNKEAGGPRREPPSEATTHSLARLLRPFVVTLDVYAFDRKPEEKWKFPNERTYASNQAKCLCVVGVKNVSIGIYQIA